MAYSKLEVENSDNINNIGLETELRFLPAQGRAQLCNILNSDSGKLMVNYLVYFILIRVTLLILILYQKSLTFPQFKPELCK